MYEHVSMVLPCGIYYTHVYTHTHTHTHTASSSRALDTLADVLGDFLSKLSKLLRINADQQAESGDVGFQVTACPGREYKITDSEMFMSFSDCYRNVIL